MTYFFLVLIIARFQVSLCAHTVCLCVFMCLQIKLSSGWTKTEVCPKTLNPKWNSQWFKFNVSVMHAVFNEASIIQGHNIVTIHYFFRLQMRNYKMNLCS